MNKRMIDASSGVCPIGPSKKVKAAVRKAVKRVRDYPDPRSKRLKKFFSSKFGVPDGGIIFGNSLRELIFFIPAFFRPKRVLVAGPAPALYEEAASASGAEVLFLEGPEHSGFMPGPGIIMQNLEGIDLLFIANPNRVTGRLMDKDGLDEILRDAGKQGTIVALDESLIEFAGEDREGLINQAPTNQVTVNNAPVDNVIVLGTTALFYGLPGLELAWAASSPRTIGKMEGKKHWDTNVLAEEAAVTALKDKAYKKLAGQYIEDEKRLFMKSLRKVKGVECHASGANVFLLGLGSEAREALQALSRAGFLLGEQREQEGGGVFLSVSVMSHDQNLKFIRIVKEAGGRTPPSDAN